MGISKMKYINVYGPDDRLQQTLGAIARAGCFAPEENQAIHSAIRIGTNQYEPLLLKAKGLLKDLGHSSLAADFIGSEDAYTYAEAADFLEKFAAEVAQRSARKTKLESDLELYTKTADLLSHMQDIDVSIDDLFKINYLHIRIGRLPKNSYVRLKYYSEKGFNFTNYFNFMVYDFDGEYYWGLYFAPDDSKKDIDDIFNSLYFERIWVPEFVHGTPEEALAAMHKRVAELQNERAMGLSPAGIVSEDELRKIQDITAWLHLMDQLYEMKRYAMEFNHTFYISGFVPEEENEQFTLCVGAVQGVKIKEAAKNQEIPVKPPTKLHNGAFARPFQMFTEMYGMPSSRDLDPTGIVAVVYAVLYGIMFADMGQGIVLFLISYFYMYKKRKMAIGNIIARCSIFSVIFGFLFGSLFGNEEIIGEVLEKLHIPFHPMQVMDPANTNTLLFASIAIGIVVVGLAIFMGILTKLRRGIRGEAITSPNGVAGFVFYLGIVLLVLDNMLLHMGFSSNPAFLIALIGLPLVAIWLQEPLSQWIDGGGLRLHNPADTLVSGFFELFVAMLEYLSHTVSFLRVGGFVFAHAGMMSVVMTLTAMAGPAGGIVVLAIGNGFVIALEGLIVGIQALRLNYYELFSRFFEADGTPFSPLVIQSDTQEL